MDANNSVAGFMSDRGVGSYDRSPVDGPPSEITAWRSFACIRGWPSSGVRDVRIPEPIAGRRTAAERLDFHTAGFINITGQSLSSFPAAVVQLGRSVTAERIGARASCREFSGSNAPQPYRESALRTARSPCRWRKMMALLNGHVKLPACRPF